MKNISKKIIFGIADLLLVPFSLLFLPFLKLMRKHGVQHFPLNLKAFLKIGVFPIRNHYYEPQLVFSKTFDAQKKRTLAINFDIAGQINRLQDFKRYLVELDQLDVHNPSFAAGDAEMYYLMIRNNKPKQIIEIGSGYSTLVALEAIKKNKAEGYKTELTCIEPFEKEWLEKMPGITLIRKPVEQIPVVFFQSLQENDILFIDSSHIIRPENEPVPAGGIPLYTGIDHLRIIQGLFCELFHHLIYLCIHYRPQGLDQVFSLWRGGSGSRCVHTNQRRYLPVHHRYH